MVNSVFDWLGIVFCGLAAHRLFGPRVALLAMILLAVSLRYFGHSMNNPKDIPFSAMACVVLCAMATARTTFPDFSGVQSMMLAVGVGLTINVRPGGILFLCYIALLLSVLTARGRDFAIKHLCLSGAQLIAIAVVALVLGTVFWPWAQAQPLVRPFEALVTFSDYTAWDGRVLYRGEYLGGGQIPWDYPFLYFLITTPPVVLVGSLLSIVMVSRRSGQLEKVAGLWFLFLFPLVFVVVLGSVLYDGIRHLLFAYTPLILVGAAGWIAALQAAQSTVTRAMLSMVLLIGLLEPFVFQVRNHPFQTVYFNQVVGGPHGAQFRFDLDYWGNSLLKAVEWTQSVAERSSYPVMVSSGRRPDHVVELDTHRFPGVVFLDHDKNTSHFHIELLRDHPGRLQSLLRQPNIVHTVQMADGTPLCVITMGPGFKLVADRLVMSEASSERTR